MMEVSTSLQIPDSAFSGPSRSQYGPQRPVSVSVQPSAAQSGSQSARRQRASHTVVSSQQHQQQQAEEESAFCDVYSHPAAVAYAAARPRRTIPKFGPYILLQTLGEGEFGKVKLGLHVDYGEEVAVKLIRKGNVEAQVRMSKIQREVEVLRSLKHPNIVRLYDVIETDKYIGIILEYASGGELFDHILAHRYLKEKDAAKLFSQLISGVWYIHQKKIVHRDLKLENLLLDRHRNVIITDFGFANRFEHRSDDLMQTSCGSPCYAAPELVISEGLYVGSAVDIWSCGVILYAMLAGYLPFDDDPANPDGDNINLLYKYIVNTPLSFPDYVSEEARDLLCMMLVPDPQRRADLPAIMGHSWLSPWTHFFKKSVEELEQETMEQQHSKRMAYQRQMKQTAAAAAAVENNKTSRSQSVRPEMLTNGNSSVRSRSYKEPHQQPEYLYETSADQSAYSSHSVPVVPTSSRRNVASEIVVTSTREQIDDDPFAAAPQRGKQNSNVYATSSVQAKDFAGIQDSHVQDITPTKVSSKKEVVVNGTSPAKTSGESAKKKDGFRHTIQVEYGGQHAPHRSASESRRSDDHAAPPSAARSPTSGEREQHGRRPSVDVNATKPLPAAPTTTAVPQPSPQRSPSVSRVPQTPTVSVDSATPPLSPNLPEDRNGVKNGTDSSGSTKSRHRKGLSVDKFGLGKIFGGSNELATANGDGSQVPSESSGASVSYTSDTSVAKSSPSAQLSKRPSTQQPMTYTPSRDLSENSLLSPDVSTTRKSRRSTLIVSLNQSIKRGKRAPSMEPRDKEKAPMLEPMSATRTAPPSAFPHALPRADSNSGSAMSASTGKARKVMEWFRSKSKGGSTVDLNEGTTDSGAVTDYEKRGVTPTQKTYDSRGAAASSSSVNQMSQFHDPSRGVYAPGHPTRTASNATDHSFSNLVKRRVGSSGPVPPKNVLRIHHGAVDHSTITTKPPPEVMARVHQVLLDMGIAVEVESDYKYRCIRPKKKRVGLGLKDAPVGNNGLAAYNMVGSAASNGVDKRGLPLPSPSSFSGTGGMLRGLLMRRQSSQVSPVVPDTTLPFEEDSSIQTDPTVVVPEGSYPVPETIYGDPTQDVGDEVRFAVELTRLDRLDDTYSLDIRRMKGNLRSYKFLYEVLRDKTDLQR